MSFQFINKTLRLNNLKTRTAMNAKISVFVICVEAIIYLFLNNLHDCTFHFERMFSFNIPFCLMQIVTSVVQENIVKFSS